MLATHMRLGGQEPQSSTPPHPSPIIPQLAPSASHVCAVQPHLFVMPPPPHVFGAMQLPQWSIPPHPSGASPHE
jgi:hypothetical protein